MTASEKARAEIEAYLEAVEGAMAGRPEGVKQEILEELRGQIDAAMDLTDGSAEAAGRILAEMDAPESFRVPEGEGMDGMDETFGTNGTNGTGGDGTKTTRRRGVGWWGTVALMAVSLGVGYWLGAGGAGGGVSGGDDGDGPEVVEENLHRPVMTVRKLDSTGLTEDLEANLVLKLSADPAMPSLKEKLILTDGNGKPVEWRLAGRLGKGLLVLTTSPIATRTLKARLESGLESEDPDVEESTGEWGWEVKFEGILELEGWSSEVTKFGATRSIELKFSEALAGRDILDHITVEPDADWHGAVAGSRAHLYGDFTPGETYKVTVEPGPWGMSGTRLAKAAEGRVRMDSMPRSVRFAKDARTYFFAPGESGKLRVETCGLDEATVSVRKMHTNNVPRFDADDRWPDGMNFGKWKVWDETVQIDDERLGLGHLDLDFSEFAKTRGVYDLKIEWNRWDDLRAAVVVSDLGIAAQDWPDSQKTVAWVNRLGTGEPVADAQVELWTQKGQLALTGRTDADGCVWLDWSGLDTEDLGDATMLTAQADGDWTCLDLRMRSPDPAGPGEGRAWLEKGKYEALVWTERNLYRPGEKMLVQALARGRDLRGPGKAFPAVLVLRKTGERNEIQSVPVEVGRDGGVTAELQLAAGAATGEYLLQLVLPGKDGEELGRTKAYVEDFVPPTIRVAVAPEPGMKKGGEKAKVKITAENMFGGMAAGLDVDVKSRVVPRKFRPAGWEDWTFGKADDKDIEGDSCSARLDENGEATVELVLPRRVPNGGAVSLAVSATVHEAGGRTVTKTADADYDLHGRYVGLRPCWKGTVQQGKQRVELALVGADGKGIEGEAAVEVILKRVAWHNLMRNWSWTTERQEVEVQRVAVVAGGTARSWEFDVEEGGDYVIQVRDPQGGAVTRLEFEAGWDSWWAEKPMERPEAVEVKWVPDDAQPGQRVKLVLAAPFAGDALVAVSGEGPLGCRRVAMGGDHSEMEWVVGEDWPETVYATVEVVRGAADHGDARGARAMGNGRLKVRRPKHELTVEVAAPEKVRPQDVLKVEVRALRDDGSPAKGKATVTATDAAILEMSETEAPRVVEAFLDPRRWTGRLRDPYGRLLPALAAGRSADGGDAPRRTFKRMNPVNSRRFKPVSLWKSDVELDGEGRATVEIPLPEFSGELRVTAVARNRDAAGVSTQAVKVARAVTVEPALPRFAAPGDRFTAGVPVWSQLDEAVELEAEYGAAGPLQVASARETIAVPAGGRGNGSVEVSAGPKAGPAEFRIRVKGGGETYEEAIELPVRPAGALQLRETFEKVEPGAWLESEAPEGWLEGSAEVQVEVSAGASLRMGGALEALLRYPYDCLEQTVSKAYPLVGSEEWVQKLAPQAWGVASPRGRVEAAIQRVVPLLDAKRGFAMWPGGSWYDTPASLYALEFLLAADEAGYRVPESVLDAGLEWAREMHGTPAERAWAADLLSQGGKFGWQSLLARRCELVESEDPGDEGRIHLARAQQRAGHPKEALALLESVPVPRERWSGRDGWVDSPVRKASLLLRAWLEIDAEAPVVDELAQVLASWQVNGNWGDWATQDNAMGLVAFGKIARRLPEEPGEPEGLVRTEGPNGATERVFAGARRWSGGVVTARKVTVCNTGKAPIYVRLTWGGVSEEPPPAEERGVKIHRELFGYHGEELSDWTLKRGQLAVVKLTVESVGGMRDHLVVEDLLPAGWEIENPQLKNSEKVAWVENAPGSSACRHREARDDRMLYFLHGLDGKAVFHYVVRAVTPGDYVLPGSSVSGMYDPGVLAREAGGRVAVLP